MAILLLSVYLVLVTSPLYTLLLTAPYTDHTMSYELGKAFALMGLVILSLQFFLSSRQKWVERYYGLDMIFSFHKGMAILAGILILSHPVLLAIGSGNFKLLFSFDLPWYILLGKLGLLLLLAQILVSGFRKQIKLKFEHWRPIHNVIGGVLLLGIYVHSLSAAGNGDLGQTSMQALWGGFFVIALGSYTYHKLYMPARRKKHAYIVDGVHEEANGVYTLALEPPKGKKRFNYRPGQFHFITLLRSEGLPREEHHFTISSSPTNPDVLTSTIKESGDFTSTIKYTKAGDTASVEAPFGRFSYTFHPNDKNFVFIAGGIGITPLMSMLRHMRDTGANFPVTLFYANRYEKNIVFKDELKEMESGEFPKLKVIHILSQPSQEWNGESGHVDANLLEKYVDDFQNKAFYICCPAKMRQEMLRILKEKQVKTSQLRLEEFSL